MYDTIDIPKVTLHEHLEGSVSPDLARQLARKHKVDLGGLVSPDGTFQYDRTDFGAFIEAYDKVSGLVIDADDYYNATYSFLFDCAEANAIYAELIISPAHMAEKDGELNAREYMARVNAVQRAITDAGRDRGIQARLIATGVRNCGVANVDRIAEFIRDNPHEAVVGFGIAGNELENSYEMFRSGFGTAKKMGLRLSLHAGEIGGPENIHAAIAQGAGRIGHGIAAIHDEKLMALLVRKGILLEICPTSNSVLVNGINDDYSNHPLRRLYDAGVRISLNTDDAGLVGATLGGEYEIARTKFGFNRTELIDISLCAVEAAFIDAVTKEKLCDRIYESVSRRDLQEFKRNADNAKSAALKERMLDRMAGRIKCYE